MNNDYNKIPTGEQLDACVLALRKNGIDVFVEKNATDAFNRVCERIPKNSKVMVGGSQTIRQIGFIKKLESVNAHWIDLHAPIYKENDATMRLELRRNSLRADYFLGSVNAITIQGQLMLADRSGTRVSAYGFAANNIILVSSINKIVDSLEDGFKRIREHVLPLEDERMKKIGESGSTIGKWLIIEKEFFPHRITLILVVEDRLGF